MKAVATLNIPQKRVPLYLSLLNYEEVWLIYENDPLFKVSQMAQLVADALRKQDASVKISLYGIGGCKSLNEIEAHLQSGVVVVREDIPLRTLKKVDGGKKNPPKIKKIEEYLELFGFKDIKITKFPDISTLSMVDSGEYEDVLQYVDTAYIISRSGGRGGTSMPSPETYDGTPSFDEKGFWIQGKRAIFALKDNRCVVFLNGRKMSPELQEALEYIECSLNL